MIKALSWAIALLFLAAFAWVGYEFVTHLNADQVDCLIRGCAGHVG